MPGVDVLTARAPVSEEAIPAGPDAQQQAEEACEEIVRQVEQGRQPRTNATLGQLIDEHLSNANIERRTMQTLQGYARKHIHALPIGGRTISEVGAQVLETFYATAPLPRPPRRTAHRSAPRAGRRRIRSRRRPIMPLRWSTSAGVGETSARTCGWR